MAFYSSGEAHGGYTFCGLASLVLLKKTHLLDANDTLRWLVNRQESSSGGFQVYYGNRAAKLSPMGQKSPILKIFPIFLPISSFPPFVIIADCYEKLPKNAWKCVKFQKISACGAYRHH